MPLRASRRRGCMSTCIASPEYAHGIAGAMKNALDWLVSYEGFVGKPIASINTSPRALQALHAFARVGSSAGPSFPVAPR